jgi:hypothetical protein
LGFWLRIERILGISGFGEKSEKGSSRECTENWVTRWILMFLGEYWDLRCFAKRIEGGGVGLGWFGESWAVSARGA